MKHHFTQKYLFVALALSLLFSNVTFAESAKDIQQIKAADWHAQQIKPGIVLKQAQFSELFGAPQSISVVEIDLTRSKVHLGIAADASERILTSQFAKDSHAIAALNGTFFNMKNGGAVMLVKRDGKIINKSTIYSERGGGAISIDGNQVCIIAADPKDAHWDEALTAPNVMVSGPVLMIDGKPAPLSQAAFNRLSHPRSAVGITPDCKLLLVAVDGRDKQAGGMSLFSLATLMETLGASSALNLDGGGSTALYVKGQTPNGIVSHPSDNNKFDHYGERKVANAIVVTYE